MPGDIDRVGAFRGTVDEIGVGSTRNGFPQCVLRVKATQKWVDTADEMAAFELTEPGWVDWSSYEQYATGYLVLMGNDKKNPGATKPLFHVENLQSALGWDAASFSSLNDQKFVGKTITFWMEENEYEGNVTIRLNAVDAADAPPVRSLRVLDAAGIKDLDAKFAGVLAGARKPGPAATPAKAPAKTPPTAAPGKSAPGAAKATPAPTPTNPTTASPSKAPPSKGAPAKTAPAACTKDQAWDSVVKGKGSKSDDDVANAWLAACDSIAPDVAEEAITNEQWAAIRDAALKALA